jgi:hypothetical protein
MGLKKGQTNNPKGRPKGSQNTFNRNVKDAILDAYEKLGGLDGFVNWAVDNQTEYYRMFGRLAPIETKSQVEGALNLNVLTGIPE